MRESEYLQSLHFNCLRTESGSLVNMSLPIVLAIDDDTKTRIGSSPTVGLVGPNGDLVGILRRLAFSNFDSENILYVYLNTLIVVSVFDSGIN